VGTSPKAIAVDEQTGWAFIANQGSNTGSVLDARTGVVLRTLATGVPPATVAVDARTRRAFVVAQGNVAVFNTAKGTIRTTTLIPYGLSALAVDGRDRHVFIVTSDQDTVSMLDARSGVVLRTSRIAHAPQAVAVDERRGLVFVASLGPTDLSRTPAGNGRLSVLDGQTGKVIHSVVVGVAPAAVSVDEQSGRVIVVNAGGRVRAPAWWQQWLHRVVPGIPQPAPTTWAAPGRGSVVDEVW
jgi:DNA-binding beta-propeller fold protein YncE